MEKKFITKIIDDFLFVDATEEMCHNSLEKFIEISRILGIPLAANKTVFPSKIITFLGIELNSKNMTACLPQEKLSSYSREIDCFSKRNSCNLRELKSITGKLQFATSVIPSGRCFLRRMYNLTIGKKSPKSKVILNSEVLDDLKIWEEFLSYYNGITIISERKAMSPNQNNICTDASSWGFGGTFEHQWIQGEWPSQWQKLNIAVLELYPIYILVEMYQKHFVLYVDPRLECPKYSI